MLLIIVVAESGALVTLMYRSNPAGSQKASYVSAAGKAFSIPYYEFNQPISNDSEYKLDSSIEGSWAVTVQANLVSSSLDPRRSEAQIAFAPEYPIENLSIPTIIVQMRGDGLLRIEYYAQNWENSYGFVLYNSTSPSWIGGQNITLTFTSFAPPVPVNPQLAPRPNGNLTIAIGNTVVLSDYMISWSNLSSFYVYGVRGSTFTGGTVSITTTELKLG